MTPEETAEALHQITVFAGGIAAWPEGENPFEWIKRVTYKPMWSFHLEFKHGYLRLIIEVIALDTRHLGAEVVAKVKVGHPYSAAVVYMPEDWTRAQRWFLAWVRNCIQQTELHEMDEWLRFDGDMLNDPHKENAFSDR